MSHSFLCFIDGALTPLWPSPSPVAYECTGCTNDDISSVLGSPCSCDGQTFVSDITSSHRVVPCNEIYALHHFRLSSNKEAYFLYFWVQKFKSNHLTFSIFFNFQFSLFFFLAISPFCVVIIGKCRGHFYHWYSVAKLFLIVLCLRKSI